MGYGRTRAEGGLPAGHFVHRFDSGGQVINFPNVMSKFLMLGMPLDQVVACTTFNASRVFPVFRNRGTLRVGAPADVAVLDLREGSFEFVDNFDQRIGSQRLFPTATVLDGKWVTRA
jgi:dihydroorotase